MTIILAGCGGGGGTGSSSAPSGGNAGVPSVVTLLPVQFIAQTNSFITLKARVLDGNGNVVQNYPVSFTNMSLTGVLSAVTANTDKLGNAEVRISSTTPGFATILVQVTTGSGIVRDRKTIFFSTNDVLAATMSLDVNSVPGNSTYNENSDFNIFETATDDTVEVLATIFDAGGVPVSGGWGVSWATSHAEAVFVRAETETNVFGQAKAVIQVIPASIRDTETHVNISAFAANGSFNMVTLFLQPVVVSPSVLLGGLSSLSAVPTTVAPSGTSALTAVVKLSTGTAAPDGTTVNFTTTCGTVTPFSQTTGGVAPGTFTAPLAEGTCTVTGTVAGVEIGSVDILVARALSVFPTTGTIIVGDTKTFAVSGGTAPYSVASSDTTKATVTVSGGVVSVVGVAAGAATVSVRDSVGATVTVTITVINPTALNVTPASIPMNCTAGGSQVFTILSGTPAPFPAVSGHPGVTIAGSPVPAVGGTFTATVAPASCGLFAVGTTPVTITVSTGAPITFFTVTVNVTNP